VNTRSARLSRGPRLLRAGTLGGCFRQSLPAVACSSRFAQPLQAAGSTKATRAGRLRQRWRRDHLGQAPHFGQSTLGEVSVRVRMESNFDRPDHVGQFSQQRRTGDQADGACAHILQERMRWSMPEQTSEYGVRVEDRPQAAWPEA
jgi:hypothetical protein